MASNSPPERFSPDTRLQCDEMLASLARWLRAAGHDTKLAPAGTPDAEILARCRDEERRLLTRDRSLAGIGDGVEVHLLESDRLDDQARELTRLGIDWCHAPFTRCMADNSPLVAAPPARAALAPPPFADRPDDIRFCPVCERLYWPGGHVRRMLARLSGWRG